MSTRTTASIPRSALRLGIWTSVGSTAASTKRKEPSRSIARIPPKSSFQLTIKTDSIDTANKARDEHLRQPDYFDTKQFPTISFVSTDVKAIDGGYEVQGDFTMHGVTKSITLVLKGGKESEFKGTKRVPFSTELSLKRSDFGFDKNAIGPIGDEALIMIDCEGMRK